MKHVWEFCHYIEDLLILRIHLLYSGSWQEYYSFRENNDIIFVL